MCVSKFLMFLLLRYYIKFVVVRFERFIKDLVEGNVWYVDYIVVVVDGGGEFFLIIDLLCLNIKENLFE